jgi:hypothetical protein
MKVNRRTLLTAISGTAAVALAGCSGNDGGDGNSGGNGDGNSDSTESDEWAETDISQRVEYDFPEGERITYESNPPAEVQDLGAFVRGDVLEVRGTLVVSEQIRQVVEIQAEFQQGEEVVAQPDTTLERPGPEEDHSFTVTTRSSEVGSIDSFTLYVRGPEPQA